MSEIRVKVADERELEVWDKIVDSSEMGTIFHKSVWLKAAEKHTKSKLYPLIGYEGREAVSVFPIFFKKRAFIKMAFSPPPKCAIPYMGPVFRHLSSRQTSIEKLHDNIVNKTLSFLTNELQPDYISIKTQRNLLDIRSFLWWALEAHPNYTYMVPIERNTKSLFEGLSNETRVHIRKAEKEKQLEVRQGDITYFKALIRMTTDRYQEQGKDFGPSSEYLMKIYESFPENIDVVGLIHDGQIVGGLILLKYRDVVAHWLAGITPLKRLRGANELLHWWVIKKYKEKGYKYYELIGANTKHLCKFKSKFNPSVNVYFRLTKRNHKSRIAESIYNRLKSELK
jgi:lipid II:glycine glycyltransferase (peptidoglycan interpeptide bridge formation enzyme)